MSATAPALVFPSPTGLLPGGIDGNQLPLEPARIYGEGELARQHLDEQLWAVRHLGRHEHATLAHRPHLTLDPVEGPEGGSERSVQIGHGSNIPRVFAARCIRL